MANAIYDLARQAFLSQSPSIDMDTDNIKAVLVRTDGGHYTVDLAAHQFLSDIAGGDRISTSGNLTTKTILAGVFDADDVTFTAVTGAQVGAIVLYKDTGTAGTSPLIAYIDTVTGFPYTPSGADATIVWPSGSTKIFKL
jgi:hypothetical protein